MTTRGINEWMVVLAYDWRQCYPIVREWAQAFLNAQPADNDPGADYTTTELVEELFPESLARGDMILKRQKVFKALQTAVANKLMPGYWHPGPASRYMGRNTNPPRWHRFKQEVADAMPREGEIECPCCGSKFVPAKGGRK